LQWLQQQRCEVESAGAAVPGFERDLERVRQEPLQQRREVEVEVEVESARAAVPGIDYV